MEVPTDLLDMENSLNIIHFYFQSYNSSDFRSYEIFSYSGKSHENDSRNKLKMAIHGSNIGHATDIWVVRGRATWQAGQFLAEFYSLGIQ